MTQFYSIDYNKTGYILKKQGSWYLTQEHKNPPWRRIEKLALFPV